MAKIQSLISYLQYKFTPLHQWILSGNGFVIRISRNGVVQDFAARDDYLYLQKENLLKRNIRDLYHLPSDCPLDSLAISIDSKISLKTALFPNKVTFPSRNRFERADILNQFFTLIPFSVLSLRKTGKEELLGIIHHRRLTEYAALFVANPFLLADAEGRIQGVNRAFLSRFPQPGRNPALFLGHSLDRFMSPSPIQWISGDLPAKPSAPDHRSWQEILSINFMTATRSSLEKNIELRDLACTAGKWSWSPSPKSRHLLRFHAPMDSTRWDFRLVLELDLKAPHPPCVIVNGDSGETDTFPDFDGYLLGPSSIRQGFAVKKEGENVHEKGNEPLPLPGPQRIEVTRTGSLLSYSIDGRCVIAYRDPVPMERETGHFYLYHPRKGKIGLSALRLLTRAKSDPSQDPPNETAFLNEAQSPFQFQQIYHHSLTFPDNRFLYGFSFISISRLKDSLETLEKARTRITRERDHYKAMAVGPDPLDIGFLGDAPVFLRLKAQAEVAARSPATLLIEGETGSGKGVLARFIHQKSPHADGPFVRVDCAALPESLIESELFGHEKGAFTGADKARAGKFEEAEGGTLFLDEIGNLSPAVQAKLLNFLQEFTIERLGSNVRRKVRARVITASNQPLDRLVKEGKFREDLYFRLNAIKFTLPPLRERKEDIAILCEALFAREKERLGRSVRSISAAAYQKLLKHTWPGNIRELENVIQKAVLFCDQEEIGPEHLELAAEIPKDKNPEDGRTFPVGNSRALKREHLEILLERNNHICRWAAKEAGISEATLYRKIKKFGIKS